MDLETALGLDLLGVVPRLSWMWSAQRPHVVRRGRRPVVVETFLATASQFELRGFNGCPRRIVVSSTLPGEGKSVVSCNLAAAFTRLGYRALLIDCDLRRPTQHGFHQCGNRAGLLAWIQAGCPENPARPEESLGWCTLPDGTQFIPAGGRDSEAPRHFLLPRVRALFDQFARDFDVTIIDTPPAGVFPDAYFLARLADASALVVREGVAELDQVRKVVVDFERMASPVTGIIFNDIVTGASHPSFEYRTTPARYAQHYRSHRHLRRWNRPPPDAVDAPTETILR